MDSERASRASDVPLFGEGVGHTRKAGSSGGTAGQEPLHFECRSGFDWPDVRLFRTLVAVPCPQPRTAGNLVIESRFRQLSREHAM
jgi:hypothetical protein